MQWKKFAIENLAELFERPNKKSQQQKESESIQGELLKTIGTQKIELDFLKKVSATVRKRANVINVRPCTLMTTEFVYINKFSFCVEPSPSLAIQVSS